MHSNHLDDTKIEQAFERLVSAAAARLKAEGQSEHQWLRDSFMHLTDKARALVDREVNTVTADLQYQFLGLVEQAQIILRETEERGLERCSRFLEKATSVLYQDIRREVAHLDAVLERARPVYDRINIFSILNIARQEDPQSYFLAWLLDPNKPHGFGDRILRAFLKEACCIVKEKEFDYHDLRIEKVKIEAQKVIEKVGVVDVEITGDNFICVTENKVLAGETRKNGISQLKRYADHYTAKAEEEHQFLLLLYLVPPADMKGNPRNNLQTDVLNKCYIPTLWRS